MPISSGFSGSSSPISALIEGRPRLTLREDEGEGGEGNAHPKFLTLLRARESETGARPLDTRRH